MQDNHKFKLYSGSFSKHFGLFFSLIILALIAFSITQRQAILDWYRLKDYKPSNSISTLADETTMTARSRNLFYASHPAIEDAIQFNKNCQVAKEKTIVLGCYIGGTAQRIYLFNVTDTRLNGVEEVTAAHETLHAAYERMNKSEKEKLDAMLKVQMNKLSDDSHLQDLIVVYNKKEPGQLYNEMHSIIGTEYKYLDPELEQYYSQYFTNRQAVVDYSDSYKQVFNQMQDQLTQDQQLMRDLKNQIDRLNNSIETQKNILNVKSNQLNELKSSDLRQYNDEVPAYNALINQFNQTITRQKNLISQYNNLVESHNQIAVDYNKLNNELNSQYQPMPQQN